LPERVAEAVHVLCTVMAEIVLPPSTEHDALFLQEVCIAGKGVSRQKPERRVQDR